MNKNGFTMLEMMSVVVIASILLVSGVFVLNSAGNHYRLRSATMMIRQDMALARQLTKEKGHDYGISFNTTQWKRIYLTSSGDTVEEKSSELPHGVTFGFQSGINKKVDGTSTTPPANGIDFTSNAVVFYPRTATQGAVYLTTGDETKTIEISSLGSPRVYDWDGYNWKKQK